MFSSDSTVSEKITLKKSFDVDEALKRFEKLEELLSENKALSLQIEKELPIDWKFQALIFCEPSKNRNIVSVLCKLALSKNFSPVIVLTSTNYKSALNSLVNSGVDISKVFVIDCVTRNLAVINDFDKVFFVDSVRNLSDIQIETIKVLELSKNSCFIFDSLDVLLLFHKQNLINKFVNSMNKILRKNSCPSFFISGNVDIFQQLSQFFEVNIEVK